MYGDMFVSWRPSASKVNCPDPTEEPEYRHGENRYCTTRVDIHRSSKALGTNQDTNVGGTVTGTVISRVYETRRRELQISLSLS